MSRPAYPRNENGEVIRPDGSIGPKAHAPKTSAVLSFDGQRLTADTGAEFVNGVWQYDGHTADTSAAELAAAEKAVEVLTAIRAALKGLPTVKPVIDGDYVSALKGHTTLNQGTLLKYFTSGK